jgi:hypothetical protein
MQPLWTLIGLCIRLRQHRVQYHKQQTAVSAASAVVSQTVDLEQRQLSSRRSGLIENIQSETDEIAVLLESVKQGKPILSSTVVKGLSHRLFRTSEA